MVEEVRTGKGELAFNTMYKHKRSGDMLAPTALTPEATSNAKIHNISELITKLSRNASQVVDENGEPMVVYHGTNNEFSVFKKGLTFFTTNDYIAESYGDNTLAVYLNIVKPLDLRGKNSINNLAYSDRQLVANIEKALDSLPDDYTVKTTFETYTKGDLKKELVKEYNGIKYIDHNYYPVAWDAIHKFALKEGYDGWFHNDESFDRLIQHSPSFGVFSPNQIKSATGNNGAFDENNPNIRFKAEDSKGNINFGANEKKDIHKEKAIQTQINWGGETLPFKRNEAINSSPRSHLLQRKRGYIPPNHSGITFAAVRGRLLVFDENIKTKAFSYEVA
jgi:hypothetical protein